MRIVNVLGDGSCFFRSIFVFLNSMTRQSLIREEDFVKSMRHIICRQVRNNKNNITRDIYRNMSYIRQTDLQTFYMILESFPSWFVRAFRNFPSNEREFRKVLCQHISKIQSWVSEIEVRLTQEYFEKTHNMKIVILNSVPKHNMTFKKRTIYLLNISEYHYNAILKS